MDLEIVGRHALFFDDDSMATFVNSPTALVDWNSLFIDRYDVRHLLSSPPPPRPKRRRSLSNDPDLEAELNHERYLDLPTESPSPSHDMNDISANTNADGFRAVPFSYGSSNDFSDQKNADMESEFHPPFPMPDYLLQNLPPTEKLHQIIARTSSFVSKHGGQSEIVLRVKQGGNPTFGFLMPDHHLHPYFRFLVEHQELLTGKSLVEDKKNEGVKDGGALSLLGSVYGTLEDEDTKDEPATGAKTNESDEGDDGVRVADSSGPEGSNGAAKIASQRDAASMHSLSSNDQASFVRRNPSVSSVNIVERKHTNTEDNVTDKFLTSDNLQSSASLAQPKLELQILEPPIEMKRVIEKIVDFIQKNGKELEATLAAQDVKYGMFPFLRPSSMYHSYYRKVLQEAEELKSCDKGDIIKREDMKHEKIDCGVKDGKHAFQSVLPDDSVKKEKQKMVKDRPKTELHHEPFKPVQPQTKVTVDANTAAAILQVARRGIRNPQLGILSGKPINEASQSLGNDRRSPDMAKSTGQLISGSAASTEAESSEAGLSKEQKLKAERLKRAKMFVAMLKPSVQPVQQAEPSQSLSVEPLDFGISGSGANAAKEREGSSISFAEEIKQADDVNSERRSKRNYRLRSQRDEDDEMEEEEEEEREEEENSMEEATEDSKTDKKHYSRRKQYDRRKHKRRYSSKDRHSRDKRKHESSSDDEYHSRSSHRHKHRKSSDRHELYDSSENEHEHKHSSGKHNKDDYSKDKRSHNLRSRNHDKHRGSSDDEHRHHRHRSSRRKNEDSSGIEEHDIRQKSSKRAKKDEERVEEKNVLKADQCDRKASPQNEPTQVSDELRAKIRAMLADTL